MDSIQDAIRDYIQLAITDVLENIMTDFEAESKDERANSLLRRLVEYYMNNVEDTPRIKTHVSPLGNEKTVLMVAPISSTSHAPLTSSDVCAVHTVDDKNFSTTDRVDNANKACSALMKSGKRKGQLCGAKVSDSTGMCKKHQPRVEKTGDTKCMALMKSGTRKGQPCGVAIASGELYCSKHRITKCIFKKPDGNQCGWSISRCSPSESYCRIHIKDELNLDVKSFVLYTNKFGNKEHKYSGLVFEDRKVVGAQNPTGTVTTFLNDEDLECVRVYGLPLCDNFMEKMKDYLNRKKEEENVT